MAKIETPAIAPEELFKIGSFRVTNTVMSAFITTVILIITAVIIRVFFIPRWEKEPLKKSGFRILIEYLVGIFEGNSNELTPHDSSFTGAFYFGSCAFILISTLLEMFGFRPPLTDFNLTLAFGICTFLIIFFLGFYRKRHRRLLHYAKVVTLITDPIVSVSIALRMFGSVFSGYIIMSLFYSFIGTSFVVPAIGNVIFTIFHALVQSYVFMFLSMSLINEAVE